MRSCWSPMSYSRSRARGTPPTRCCSGWRHGTSPEESSSRSSAAGRGTESEGFGPGGCKIIWGIRGLGEGMSSGWEERIKLWVLGVVRWVGLGSRQGQGQGTLEAHGIGRDESRGQGDLGEKLQNGIVDQKLGGQCNKASGGQVDGRAEPCERAGNRVSRGSQNH